MPKVVIINADVSLDDYYQAILKGIEAKYHNYQTTFPRYPTTEAQMGELATMASHAAHASDGIEIRGNHAYLNGQDLGHIERLIR